MGYVFLYPNRSYIVMDPLVQDAATQHYDQRPFDETMCDALIANGGVKNRQKGAKCLR